MSTVHLADGKEDPRDHTPWISLGLAYVAMVPLVAGAVAVWLVEPGAELIIRLSIL